MTVMGTTGTRQGGTPAQVATFRQFVRDLQPGELRHGACRGWDAQAARIVREETAPGRCLVVAHPGKGKNDLPGGPRPDRDEWAMDDADGEMPEKGHFQRNRDIVDACTVLVACPWQSEPPPPKTGGGTWQTIEYAAQAGKPCYIIWPDGRVESRGPTGTTISQNADGSYTYTWVTA